MEIEEIISTLKGLDLSTNPEEEIKQLLSNVGAIGYMVVTLHKGKSIMRARPNNEGERFEKKSDYSFKPQRFNSEYQRASTPHQTMFYGCILPENIEPGELNNSRIIGAMESMPWLRDKTSSGYKKISFGKWLVEEDIILIAVIHNPEYYNASNYTRELVDGYNKFLAIEDSKIKDRSLKFQEFLADEFSKEITINNDYSISAYFTHAVVNSQRYKIDGVLYPSVRTQGDGFNIAITPEACSKLALYVAGECSIYKLRDHTVVGVDRITELDGKTDEFELLEIENHQKECLEQLGVTSIEDLK